VSQAVVAGGGLAGAAAACVLARAGHPVLLVERQAGPATKICGEFLSAEAGIYLARIGIDLPTLGAHRISALRVAHGHASVCCALPFTGFGLSRQVLDEALLHQAASFGAEIMRGKTVKLKHASGPVILDIGGEDIRPETLFLATGKHDLRGLRRNSAPPADTVGFKIHLRLAPAQESALSGHIELILFAGGYAGLQLVEDRRANLCLLVSNTRLRRAGGTWEALLADLQRTEPHLRTRLAGSTPEPGRPATIFRVPYGFVHTPSAADPPGVFRLGDQMGVIPSFTGDGMSIALHTAMVASACHLAGRSSAHYHRSIRHDIVGQIKRAYTLNAIAQSPPGRALLMRLAKLWPAGLQLAANLTRVPPKALLAP